MSVCTDTARTENQVESGAHSDAMVRHVTVDGLRVAAVIVGNTRVGFLRGVWAYEEENIVFDRAMRQVRIDGKWWTLAENVGKASVVPRFAWDRRPENGMHHGVGI